MPLTITLTTGQIEITKSLVIDGSMGGTVTPTVSGGDTSRVFYLHTSGAVPYVALIGLRLVHGACSGACTQGGGILNDGTALNMRSSSLSENAVTGGLGAAILNTGWLTLTAVTLSNNVGIDLSINDTYGGAVANTGIVSAARVIFLGNHAWAGGGIENFGRLSLDDTAFVGNTASWYGGAIHNTGGLVVVTDGAFVSNTAGSDGGAIYGRHSSSV